MGEMCAFFYVYQNQRVNWLGISMEDMSIYLIKRDTRKTTLIGVKSV